MNNTKHNCINTNQLLYTCLVDSQSLLTEKDAAETSTAERTRDKPLCSQMNADLSIDETTEFMRERKRKRQRERDRERDREEKRQYKNAL